MIPFTLFILLILGLAAIVTPPRKKTYLVFETGDKSRYLRAPYAWIETKDGSVEKAALKLGLPASSCLFSIRGNITHLGKP